MVPVYIVVRSWGRLRGWRHSIGCGDREKETSSGLFGRKAMCLGVHLRVTGPVLQLVTWLDKCTTVNLNSDN